MKLLKMVVKIGIVLLIMKNMWIYIGILVLRYKEVEELWFGIGEVGVGINNMYCGWGKKVVYGFWMGKFVYRLKVNMWEVLGGIENLFLWFEWGNILKCVVVKGRKCIMIVLVRFF